ncbi:hypothetical protein DMX06_07910 [Pseudomonas mosselii]|nr:hypothetical protein DMX06_07910 [Pseudomonas mosselii]
MINRGASPLQFKIAGAALQPFRDTRPLLQGSHNSCRSGLVSRKGRKATPAFPMPSTNYRH